MIVPTIGRVVWYFPDDYDIKIRGMHSLDRAHPFAADVVFVHSDTCVNLKVHDHTGHSYNRGSVPINVEGISPRAEWMPYQKAVAGGEIKPTLHANAGSSTVTLKEHD